MLREVEATGKTLEEAKENARAALGAGPLDDVNFTIVELGSRGIFGIIGVKPSRVKATMEIPDAPQERRRERSEKPRREKNDDRAAKKHTKTKKHETKSEEKPKAKASEAVIPELELKMTRKEVKEGEDMSYEFVKALLSDIGLNAEAELYTCEDGTRRITIVGEDASTLIGHHGDTLDALQYLANLASARKNINGERDKSRVTIDIEGYRAKREETLRALARRMAAKAVRQRRSVMLEPMSAYERRIIHSEIQTIEGVSTNSVGSDNNRKIVIYLTDKKPRGIFEEEEEKRTSLKEEFAPDTDDVTASIGAVEQTVTSDLAGDEGETVAIEQTVPDEDGSSDFDDDDIK